MGLQMCSLHFKKLPVSFRSVHTCKHLGCSGGGLCLGKWPGLCLVLVGTLQLREECSRKGWGNSLTWHCHILVLDSGLWTPHCLQKNSQLPCDMPHQLLWTVCSHTFKKYFNLVHMTLLSACMSVYHLPVWCLQRPEEDIIPQEFEFQTAVNCWKLNLDLLQIRAVSALIPWALFQPILCFSLSMHVVCLFGLLGLWGDSTRVLPFLLLINGGSVEMVIRNFYLIISVLSNHHEAVVTLSLFCFKSLRSGWSWT